MSKLNVKIYAHNRDIFIKLCTEMLLRFPRHIENLSQELKATDFKVKLQSSK